MFRSLDGDQPLYHAHPTSPAAVAAPGSKMAATTLAIAATVPEATITGQPLSIFTCRRLMAVAILVPPPEIARPTSRNRSAYASSGSASGTPAPVGRPQGALPGSTSRPPRNTPGPRPGFRPGAGARLAPGTSAAPRLDTESRFSA